MGTDTRGYSPLSALGRLNLAETTDDDWDEAARVLKAASARTRARLAGEAGRPTADILEFAPRGYPLRISVMKPPGDAA